MAQKRLDRINFVLNTTGDPTASGLQDPITGMSQNYGGLEVGDYFDLTDSEALMLSNTSIGTLYGGRYQRVLVDSGATATNVQIGKLAYLKTIGALEGPSPSSSQGTLSTVTDIAHALASDLFMGVFLSSVTPGQYGFIQTSGRATVYGKSSLTNGAPAVGDILTAGALGTVDDPTQSTTLTYALESLIMGRALQAPASGTYFQAKLEIPFSGF
jgi:hypothetical protein